MNADEVAATEETWWAVVGPTYAPSLGGISVTPHDRAAYLDRSYMLGEIELRPGGERLVEYHHLDPTAFDGFAVVETHPVSVIGRGKADQFSRTQNALLKRTAALLALAYVEPWNVRCSPRTTRHNLPRLPEPWPCPVPWAVGGEPPEPVSRALPGEIEELWSSSALPQNRALLILWHEAFLAWPRHPSLAFTCFWGVLESLAHRFGSSGSSSTSSVDWSLARWSSASDDREMVHSARNRIAHGRRVFGLEEHSARLISVDLDMASGSAAFDGDDAEFATNGVGRLCAAARSGVWEILSESG